MMRQRWRAATFVHWRYEREQIESRVPDGIEVETFDGSAWVGIVAFLVQDLRLGPLPPVPGMSTMPETNVRTYVRGADGLSGVWFFSLDIAHPLVALAGRVAARLPYVGSAMEVRTRGDELHYRGARRGRHAAAARYDISVRDDEPIEHVSALEHFLTGRWSLLTFYGSRQSSVAVEHQPWPLHRGSVVRLREGLLAADGLPPPAGEPLVHVSPGVDARIGPPRLLTRPS